MDSAFELPPPALISQRITVRARPVGGPIADPRVIPDGLLRDKTSLTLLIHGFANDEKTASARYKEFRAELGPWLSRQTVDVYWPGDWATPYGLVTGKRDLGSVLLSVVAYPLQIRRAERSARRLMRRLRDDLNVRKQIAIVAGRLPPRLELRIVAHSLGCLLSLELLKSLESRVGDDLSIDVIVLMAAAVPQYRLHPDDFGGVLDQARQVRIYRSFNDKTLAVAFPIGQRLENPFPNSWSGPRRVAIGRHGCGADALPNTVDREGVQDHGDYWSDKELAREVARSLKPTALRPLDGRSFPPANKPRRVPLRVAAGREVPRGR